MHACHKNLFSCGAHQVTALMDLSNQPLEFNRNLYSHVEPYSSGFLKVSKIHTLYWEQSGNPHGHVSQHHFSVEFYMLLVEYAYYFSNFSYCEEIFK